MRRSIEVERNLSTGFSHPRMDPTHDSSQCGLKPLLQRPNPVSFSLKSRPSNAPDRSPPVVKPISARAAKAKPATPEPAAPARPADDAVVFTIDPGQRQLLAATPLARRLWGLAMAPDLLPLRLDGAMPALITLRELTQSSGGMACDVPRSQLLLFWTLRGPRRWLCQVSPDTEPAGKLATGLPQRWRIVPDRSAWHAIETLEQDRLACLAHELRTPLAVIQAFADLLLELHPASGRRDRSRDYAQNIRQAARHSLDVIASLLERPQMAQPAGEPMHIEPIALAPLAAEIAERLQPLARSAGAEVVIARAPRLAPVTGSRLAVTQILINLISNAIRHAGSAPRIRIKTGGDRTGRAWIEVADNGPGLPAAVLQRFATATGAITAAEALPVEPEPAGHDTDRIGLALSQALAASSGARLALRNGERGGACIRLVFDAPQMARRQVA